MGNPVLRGLQTGRKQQDRRILAGKANIVRQLASVASSDETLLDSPEFVARLTRVAQLWHYVLIARTLAFFSFAFFPAIPGFLTGSWQGLVMAAGIARDVWVTVLGRVMRTAGRGVG